MKEFTRRIIRALRLDPQVFEEVEADSSANLQSATVVILSGIAAGLSAEIDGPLLLSTSAAFLLGWFVWSGLAYLIGTRLFPEPTTDADFGQLLRTLGFAAAPGILRLAALLIPFASIIFWLVSFWMLAAMVIAVRQALDFQGTGRALAVCGVGWFLHLAVLLLVTIPVS